MVRLSAIPPFLDIICRQHGLCGHTLEEIRSFNITECLAFPKQLTEEIFAGLEADPGPIAPLPGAVQVLTRLVQTGVQPAIVTARTESAPIARWLATNLPQSVGVDHFRIACCGDHDRKLKHLHDLGLTHFIDDRAETCEALAEAGITSIVFDRPWNRGQHQRPQVRNWREIAALTDWKGDQDEMPELQP